MTGVGVKVETILLPTRKGEGKTVKVLVREERGSKKAKECIRGLKGREYHAKEGTKAKKEHYGRNGRQGKLSEDKEETKWTKMKLREKR